MGTWWGDPSAGEGKARGPVATACRAFGRFEGESGAEQRQNRLREPVTGGNRFNRRKNRWPDRNEDRLEEPVTGAIDALENVQTLLEPQ